MTASRHERAREELLAADDRSRPSQSVYVRWCEANMVEPFPTKDGEQTILRFLHAHWHQWGFSTMRSHALSAAKEYREAGLADPRGLRVSAYLSGVRRRKGTRARPTDALTGSDVVSAARQMTPTTPVGNDVVRLRGLAATAIALGLDPTESATVAMIWSLPVETFVLGARTITIDRAGWPRPVCIDESRQPLLHAALDAALKLGVQHGAGAPFQPREGERRSRSNERKEEAPHWDAVMLRKAWRRAHPVAAGHPVSRLSARHISDAYQAAGEADRFWFLACVDKDLQRRRRDLSYALHGIVTGHRHAELARLRISDLTETSTGYSYALLGTKGDLIARQRGGRARVSHHSVDHLEDDASCCLAHCPACALRDHLEARRRQGAADHDPLYAGVRGDVLGPQGASAAVIRFWRMAESRDEPDSPAIGTRTMRVTAVSLARQADIPYDEITQALTGHRSMNHARLYVRRLDPFSADLVLPLRAEQSED